MSFGGQWWFFTFVFSRFSSGDEKGLLGTFPRCDHIDRALLGVRGHRPKVTGACPAPLKPSQVSSLRSVPPWVSIVHI